MANRAKTVPFFRKDATLVKWLKTSYLEPPSRGALQKTSAKLEENLLNHVAQIPSLVDEIHDVSQQEGNLLKDEEDRLTVKLLSIQRELEDLRKRRERVEQHRPTTQ